MPISKRPRLHLRDGLVEEKYDQKTYTIKHIHFTPEDSRVLMSLDTLDLDTDFANNPYMRHTDNVQRRTSVPLMYITEFQPDLFFKWSQHIKLITNSLKSTVSNLVKFSSGASKSVWGEFAKKLGIEVDEGAANGDPTEQPSNSTTTKPKTPTNDLVSSFYINKETFYNDIFNTPLKMYRSFFNGKYVASYELPYTENTSYRVDGNSGWDFLTNSDIDLGSEFLTSIYKTVTNLNIADIPSIPRWKFKSSNDSFESISTTFHLYNNDLDSLGDNFKFLMKFIQGPLWLQYSSRHIPPNVYSVEIPGLIYMQYATMQVEVVEVGNKRRIRTDAAKTDLKNKTGFDIFNSGNKNIDNIFFPDAWKVEVIFRSLVPQNFNTVMNYIMNGGDSDAQKVKVDTYMLKGDIGVTEDAYKTEIDKDTKKSQ